MPQELSTHNEKIDLNENQRKMAEIILSEAPEGMSEETALILFDLCFEQSGAVGTRYGLTAEAVRMRKSRYKEAFNALATRRFELAERVLQSSVWCGIKLVSDAVALMNPKDINTPNKLAQMANAMNGIQALAEKLNPKEASTADKQAIAKGLEGIQAIKAAREDK